jgi:chemotaxis protein histidine kinase CheA
VSEQEAQQDAQQEQGDDGAREAQEQAQEAQEQAQEAQYEEGSDAQQQAADDPESAAGSGGNGASVTNGTGFGQDAGQDAGIPSGRRMPISCVFLNGRLYCTTAHATPWGVVALSGSVEAKGRPNGPADFGSDPAAERVATKMGEAMLSRAEQQKITMAAESLAERARCGDQNAMAMIAEVRKNAGRNERARVALAALKAYVTKHPVPLHQLDQMGGELDGPARDPSRFPLSRERTTERAAVALANAAPMSRDHVKHMVSTFCGGDETRARLLLAGVSRPDKPLGPHAPGSAQSLYDLGRSIGRARRLQQARDPETSLAVLGPSVAWELE